MHTFKISWFLFFILFFTITPVNADVGDISTMKHACNSSDINLKKLCKIIRDKFKELQDSYIHLGKELYLVAVPNTGQIAQGLYAVNTKTNQIVMFGGYGSPEFGKIIRNDSGHTLITESQHSMSNGLYWESEIVLQVRTNPILKTPYVISQQVSVLIDASEEIRSYCSKQKNKQQDACADHYLWGKRRQISSEKTTSKDIVTAHENALIAFKENKPEGKQPFRILEEAGVRTIIDNKPKDMPLFKYITILNDYAFFAYQYNNGRNEFAIEILDKIITLAPDYKPAHLNMSKALEHLAKFGASKYTSMPLSPENIEKIKMSAKRYLVIAQSLKEK